MNCPQCNSENVIKNGSDRNGSKKLLCKDCKKNFYDHTKPIMNNSKLGITIEEFRRKFDVDFIVTETLKKLSPDIIYEQSDVYHLTGLRAGFPGLKATLEDKKFEKYRGKIGSTPYWSHPDTIRKLVEEAILQ